MSAKLFTLIVTSGVVFGFCACLGGYLAFRVVQAIGAGLGRLARRVAPYRGGRAGR